MTRLPQAVAPIFPDDKGFDPTQVLGEDSNCARCGYNLRGLTAAGICPECGTKIELSLRGDLLRVADPRWILKLARGTLLISWGLIILFITVVGWFLFLRMARPSSFNPATLFELGARFLYAAGVWLLTEADPSGKGERRYGRARKIVRFAVIMSLAEAMLMAMRALSPIAMPLAVPMAVTYCVATIVSVIGLFNQLRYLEKLALRIPDFQISARARFLKPWITVSASVCFGTLAGLVLFTSLAGRPRKSFYLPFGCSELLFGAIGIGFGIAYLLMVNKLRRRLLEQAKIAQREWTASAT